VTNEDFQALHDKRTRGLSLSEKEQTSLNAWYARLDQEESRMLNSVVASDRVSVLHAQIQAAQTELLSVTQRIQATTVENSRLQEEIATLQGPRLGRPTED